LKWENNRPIPENEGDLLYLFIRNHEKLGFSKILSIQLVGFPDIIAIEEDRIVKIELEYRLSSIKPHYKVGGWGYANVDLVHLRKFSKKENLDFKKFRWKWNKKYKGWLIYHPDFGFITPETDTPNGYYFYVSDPNRELKVREKLWLVRKKLGIDYIVCWIEDYKLPEKEIKVINLQKELGYI